MLCLMGRMSRAWLDGTATFGWRRNPMPWRAPGARPRAENSEAVPVKVPAVAPAGLVQGRESGCRFMRDLVSRAGLEPATL